METQPSHSIRNSLGAYVRQVFRHWWVVGMTLAGLLGLVLSVYTALEVATWIWGAIFAVGFVVAQFLAYRDSHATVARLRLELDERAVSFPDIEISFTNVARIRNGPGGAHLLGIGIRITNRERDRAVSLSLRPHVHLKEGNALELLQLPLFSVDGGGAMKPVDVEPMRTRSEEVKLVWLPDWDAELLVRDVCVPGAVHFYVWDHVSGITVEATKLPTTYETRPRPRTQVHP